MIGVVGLDLYGSTLSLNLARNHEVQLYSPIYSSRLRKVQNEKFSFVGKNLKGCPTLDEFVESFDEDFPNVIVTCVNGEKNATKIVQKLATLLNENDCILDFGKTIDIDSIQKRHLTCSMHGVGYMDCSVVTPIMDSIDNPSILCSGTSTIQSEELLTEMTENMYYEEKIGTSKYLHMVISSLEETLIQSVGDIYAYCNFEAPKVKAVLTKVQKDYPNSCRLIDHISHLLNLPELKRISPTLDPNPILLPMVEESMRKGIPFNVQAAAMLNQSTSNRTEIYAIEESATDPDLNVAANALLFVSATAILETRWLLKDSGHLNDDLTRFLNSTNMSSNIISYDDDKLIEILDITYNASKVFVAHCIEMDRSVSLVSAAVSQYASIKNPMKPSNLLVAARNYLHGDRIRYLQL
jgi:6-phosphogluconate dehydrogenase